ncbi:hypothetical protein QJS83_03335 [Bdellovibrio sp. 22V]|uniref:hypothetical protein n=1 Tax=Bdellovibrio TaxID=958 RepID=UPI002542B744|nr:hypothetical protein [Bdellovibrio sp. 22V]WII72903.1 hypothetical protein QJS83_03335 [Bdellovibrio sp. 22V]
MKTTKFIEAEQIAFEEVSENWVAVKFGEEKYVIDVDTLFDLSFRCASFLAYLENQEEQKLCSSCEHSDSKVH